MAKVREVANVSKISPNVQSVLNTISDFKKAGSLDISGKLTGDNFPSTEAFITDSSGNYVFIGIGLIDVSVGKNTGPFSELPGENANNKITNFNFTIATDKKGNFTGVQIGNNKYSIQD